MCSDPDSPPDLSIAGSLGSDGAASEAAQSLLLAPGPHDRLSPSATLAPANTHPSSTSHADAKPPSSLSPDVEPFCPGGASKDRGKQLRWRDDGLHSDDNGGDDSILQSMASYRDVLLRPTGSGTPSYAATASAAIPRAPPVPAAHPVHDRLGPRIEARFGRHQQRRRGQTRLIHGLPLRRMGHSGNSSTSRRSGSDPHRHQREPSPPRVNAEGFTIVRSNRPAVDVASGGPSSLRCRAVSQLPLRQTSGGIVQTVDQMFTLSGILAPCP
ncbi:hypothetical protein HU200_007862 [Digitaria exilis]|uniref:Uncharacterized protein n=1 Tax=Digitaria exilis TaxID=1010633 RepID=A0A835KS40_9POAL|nr:hypothetical protein HU200_007862 [Digitaria exilis]